MFNKRKKQFKRSTHVDTLIGQHTTLHGNVEFKGGLHVDGTVKGNVFTDSGDSESSLSLSRSGTIEGKINAPYLVLDGLVVGNVHASQHIELAEHARISGDVYYASMEVAVGAEVNGKMVHVSESDPEPEVSKVNEDQGIDL